MNFLKLFLVYGHAFGWIIFMLAAHALLNTLRNFKGTWGRRIFVITGCALFAWGIYLSYVVMNNSQVAVNDMLREMQQQSAPQRQGPVIQ